MWKGEERRRQHYNAELPHLTHRKDGAIKLDHVRGEQIISGHLSWPDFTAVVP